MENRMGCLGERDITALALQLAKVHRRKDNIREELKSLDREEKDLAFKINSAMGLVPIQEAADKVKRVIAQMDKIGKAHKSEAMKRIWASKTEEEKIVWKNRLQEARKNWQENKKGSLVKKV